ncbi:MAG: L,D-transpeptidase [Dehalococcoidia bacterium]
MRLSRPSDRLTRRGLLAQVALLTGLGLTLPLARGVRADGGSDGGDSGRTISVPVPDNIVAGQRWVDVNLTEQAAVAMRGEEIVKVVLVTTGMPGWETPTGQFTILYRVADERMASDALGIPLDSPDGYVLDHVLWTQYFTDEGHALHDNYWRPLSVFGQEATSHGCVGMVEPDASFFWDYLDNGSLVNIHY